MSQLSPQEPSYVFGYWRPWKAESNMIDSYLDYVKDVSLVKYGSDTVGKYLQEASKEQIGAIKELGDSLGKGLNVLGKGMGVISNQMAGIDSSLSFLNRNVDLMIEQQRMSNLLLHNIAQLLQVPDSEKERQFAIERGINFFVNARLDPDLYEDALEQLLKAESLMRQDYFVLHRIGMIYLYVPKLLNPEKALDYFTRAAKYAKIESNPNAMHLVNVLTGNITSDSRLDAKNAIRQVQTLAGDSLEKAAFASYVLGRFEDAVTFQSNSLQFISGSRLKYTLAKYTARIGKSAEAVRLIESAINDEPKLYDAVLCDIDLINDQQVVGFLQNEINHLKTEINRTIAELNAYEFDEGISYRSKLVQALNSDFETMSNLNREMEVTMTDLRKMLKDWGLMGVHLRQLVKFIHQIERNGIQPLLTYASNALDSSSFKERNILYQDIRKSVDSCIHDISDGETKIASLKLKSGKSSFISYSIDEVKRLFDEVDGLRMALIRDYLMAIKRVSKQIEGDFLEYGQRYGGGLVFRIDKDKKSGLVCADKIFGIAEDDTVPDGESVADGKLNSWKIFNQSDHYKEETTITLCLKANYNGFSDWYLPSFEECEELLKRIDKSKIKGLGHKGSIDTLATSSWDRNYLGEGPSFIDEEGFGSSRSRNAVVGIRHVKFSSVNHLIEKKNDTKPEYNLTSTHVQKSHLPSSADDFHIKIMDLIKSAGNLNLAGSKLYVKGNIDSKKWKNFTSQYNSNQIGTIDDCYLYFDNTVFGSGDDGFMMTKNLFCWKNKFSRPLSTFNSECVPGYKAGADTARFYLWKDSFNVCNGASEHHPDSAGPGFTIDSNKSLIDLNRTVDVLNKILQVIKGKYNG